MGQSQTNPFKQGGPLLSQYTLQQKSSDPSLTFLTHKHTKKEYLLREMVFSEVREFTLTSQKLRQRKSVRHMHLTQLEAAQQATEDHMCSNCYKVYALWQFPHKSLADQIEQRYKQQKPFESKQLWSILACSVMGLAQLQRKGLKHECITTKTILMQSQGNVRIVDPLCLGLQTNMDRVYHNRHIQQIYLSPQECQSIQNQRPIVNKNSFKNDVFILGMLVLQCGLLQSQNSCYLDQYASINYHKLQQQLNRFSNNYEEQLRQMLQLMLRSDIRTRPDWIDLNKFATYNQENHSNSYQKYSPMNTNSRNNYNNMDNYGNDKQYNSFGNSQNLLRNNFKSHNQINRNSCQMAKNYQSNINSYKTYNQLQQKTNFQPPTYQRSSIQQQPAYIPLLNQPSMIHSLKPNVPNNSKSKSASRQFIKRVSPQKHRQSNHRRLSSKKLADNPYEPQPHTNTQQNLYDGNKPSVPYQASAQHRASYKLNTDIISQQPSSHSVVYPIYSSNQPMSSHYTGNCLPYAQTHNNNYNHVDSYIGLQDSMPNKSNNSLAFNENYFKPSAYQLRSQSPINARTFQSSFSNHFDSKLSTSPLPLPDSKVSVGPLPSLPDSKISTSALTDQPVYVDQNFKFGSRYCGYKLNGKRHGRGKFYYQDGGSYDGEWQNNTMHGYGVLYYQSNKVAYQGHWVHDQFQGKGKLYNQHPQAFSTAFDYTNFDQINDYWQYFEGQFNDDLKQGQGRLKLANGQYFEGIFKEDMVDGKGAFHCLDGRIIEGTWVQNELQSIVPQ